MASTSVSSASSMSASSVSSVRTPQKGRKTPKVSRAESSPMSGHDTDYFYASDSDTDGADERLEHRFWALRGLETIFSDEDEAFDALRQNSRRLKYMQLLSSTSVKKLRRFALS
ncbi:hypothetical protein C8F04DRAFT_1265538 [Mycena alexandri]|uniref:Uncharacterized protein n=1 Tax=Mycena alexandri TaxID=1745969 RepID=A0AAD6SIQ9_9AGAR|nr:hypothetical protein C8F04DRAFT_1265538 [Mycena alexandri]